MATVIKWSLRSLLLAVPVLAIAAAPARAVETTVAHTDFLLENAQELGDLCAANTDAAAIHMCEGFLVGVHRMYQSVANALGTRLYCLPTDRRFTRDQVAQEFSRWAAATPAAARMPAVDGLLEWAHEAYPCR